MKFPFWLAIPGLFSGANKLLLVFQGPDISRLSILLKPTTHFGIRFSSQWLVVDRLPCLNSIPSMYPMTDPWDDCIQNLHLKGEKMATMIFGNVYVNIPQN